MKKPRGDSKLKTLPKADQAKLASWLDQESQSAVIARVKKDFSIDTSPAALTDFYQWFHLTAQLQEAAGFADQLKRDLKDIPGLKLDSDQISKAAQVAFEIQAMKNKDGKLFLGLRRERTRREILALDRERFESEVAGNALDIFESDKLRRIAESNTPRAEKIAAIRKEYFKDVDELQQSGKVALPK